MFSQIKKELLGIEIRHRGFLQAYLTKELNNFEDALKSKSKLKFLKPDYKKQKSIIG